MEPDNSVPTERSGSDNLGYIAILLIAINFTVLLFLMFQAYISCSLNGLDVGIYNQIMHNMTAGNFAMNSSIEWERSHFGSHNQSILYLLYPLYALFPSSFTLGLVQVIVLSLAAFTLFKLSHLKLGHKVPALLILLAFLLYPYTWGPTLVTFFHPEVFSLFALIAAFYFLESDRLLLCFLFATLAMMSKENVALVAVALGLYIYFTKKRKAGLLFSLWGLVWFLGNVMILIPLNRGAESGQVWYSDRYSYLGKGVGEIVSSAVSHPGILFRTLLSSDKLNYLYSLFSPLLFLPLLSPATLVIALPPILQNLLSGYIADFNPVERDVFPIVALIFISLVYGLANLNRFLNKWKPDGLRRRVGGLLSPTVKPGAAGDQREGALTPRPLRSQVPDKASALLRLACRPGAFVGLALIVVILFAIPQYPLFAENLALAGLREFQDTQAATGFSIPYLEQFGASQSCREVVLYLAEHAPSSAIVTAPRPLLAFSEISGRPRAYDFSRRRREEEADYIVVPRPNVAPRPNLGYQVALDTDDYVVFRRAGSEASGEGGDLAKASPAPVSGEISPFDFLDLENATIQGALFVTRETWSIEGDEREVVFEYPQIYNLARVTYAEVPIPEDASLAFSIAMHPDVWDESGDGVLFEVTIDREPVFSRYIDPKQNHEDRKWHDFELDLANYAGQTAEISLLTAASIAGNDFTFDWAGWANPRILVGNEDNKAYDFIDSLSVATTVDADVGSGYHEIARNRRRVILEHPVSHQPAQLTYDKVFVPTTAFLNFAIGMQTEVWEEAGDGVRFEILIAGERIFSRYIDPKHEESDRRWIDFEVSLERFAEDQVDITFLVAPNEDYLWDWAVWADPYIVAKETPPSR